MFMEPSPVVTTTGSPASAVLRSLETWLSRIEAHADKTSTSVIAVNAEKARRFMIDSYRRDLAEVMHGPLTGDDVFCTLILQTNDSPAYPPGRSSGSDRQHPRARQSP